MFVYLVVTEAIIATKLEPSHMTPAIPQQHQDLVSSCIQFGTKGISVQKPNSFQNFNELEEILIDKYSAIEYFKFF